MSDLLFQLSEPFHPSEITWKPGTLTKNRDRCLAMAYGDLRAYMDRLDAVCGPQWSVVYRPWGNRIIAELTIAGITRSSTGEMDAQDEKTGIGGTVAEAQAFKRACAMWGLGRYLYNLPSSWVEYDAQANRITESGQAKLNSTYAAYYKKAMKDRGSQPGAAAGAQAGAVAQAEEMLQGQPDPGQAVINDDQLAHLWAVVRGFYTAPNEAEEQMPQLVSWASQGNENAPQYLLVKEYEKILTGIQRKKDALAKAKATSKAKAAG